MTAFRTSGFLFPALWTAVLFAQPVAPVTIASGRITGKDLGEVQAWLGIPYAAPPIGDLRWKPPQPPSSWNGVRAMDHYGAVCMQSKVLAAGQPMSEDCLTLNVRAPKGAQKAAVMLWIHGGAFVEGSGAMPVYAGTELARQGVVVVTINYRLGDFGFFAHSANLDYGKHPLDVVYKPDYHSVCIGFPSSEIPKEVGHVSNRNC
jgi:para-nitrobenzyl esterase